MPSRRPTCPSAVILLTALLATSAAARTPRGLCGALATDDAAAPRIAVLSAFPAEMAPLVAAAQVEQTVTVGDRSYHLATLAGVRVVLGLLGIGMVNATDRAQSVLANFDVAGVVVSGVAGSPPHNIGDVLVLNEWMRGDFPRPFRANAALLELARQAAGVPILGRCTAPPITTIVCLPYMPAVVFGGRGRSADFFRGADFPCRPGNDPVFGCDLPSPAIASEAAPQAAPVALEAVDMETGAVAWVATRRHLPFIAFRAASDGAGDPLGLTEPFAQFFIYYQVAADNAAAMTMAFLERLKLLGSGDVPARRVCGLFARHAWTRAAARLVRMPSPP